MKTLTANTTAAVSRPYTAPIYLLQVDFTSPTAKTLYLSDRYLASVGTHEWLPLVADWGSLESAVNSLDVNGSPGTATLSLINTMPIEGRARISDLIQTPLNADQAWEWAFAKVTVRQTFAGLTDAADLVQLGVFFLEDPTEIGEALLVLRMSDQSLVIENALKVTKVNRTEFPLCAKADIGRSIPRPFGVLRDVVAVPVIDSAVDRLNGAISASATSLELFDGSDFPASGSAFGLQIDGEHLNYATRSGNTLTGLSRAQSTTDAEPHVHGTQVYLIRALAPTPAYRLAVGEHAGGYKIRSVSNITIDGQPLAAPVAANIVLEDAAIVPGKAFAMISLNIYAKFYKAAPTTVDRDVSVSPLSSVLNLSAGVPPSGTTRTISPSSVGSTVFTIRSMNCHVTRSGNLAGVINWGVTRRLSGGSDVAVASGVFGDQDASHLTVNFSDTQNYASTADELIALHFNTTTGGWNDCTLSLVWDNYHVADSTTMLVGGGPSAIGTVRCDVEGIQDDSAGTITGTPSALLENPEDITRFVLVQLYGVDPALLGSSWALTRAALAGQGYRWAFPLGFETFSTVRRKFGEQARSVLYVEAGLWEYQFLEDAPVAPVTLDYQRDVWDGEPALIRRTNRTDVINSLNVNAAFNDADGNYRYRKLFEDLSIIPQIRTSDLTLEWVQDTATADALGAYWLGVWKRQRFEMSLTAWWNALALTKTDYLRIGNHPVLDAHGATGVVFRILRRDDQVTESRVRLEGIEAALLPAPRLPDTGEDVVFNCRLNYVNTTSIRLDPFQGNQVRVRIGGTWQVATVPDAGITKTNAGLAASTLYYVYLYDVSGTLTLEISTTGHTRDTATGIDTKSGDTSRILVGMIHTNGATQFADAANERGVLSYFNRRALNLVKGFTANRFSSSTTYVELDGEIRLNFLTWADEAVMLALSGRNVVSTTASVAVSIGIDSTTVGEEVYVGNDSSAASGTCSGGLVKAGLSEAFHYATVLVQVAAGATITLYGSGSAGGRCALTGLIRG